MAITMALNPTDANAKSLVPSRNLKKKGHEDGHKEKER